MTTPPLDPLRLLAPFARGATLREAAQALGLTRSTLSRRLAELEARLGQEVFLRRGKALVPTHFGGLLLERVARATAALAEVDALASEASERFGQRLAVSASPLFAELVLAPVLVALLARRPSLRVALALSHDYSEVFDDGVDVALRRGPLASSDSLQARRLGATTMVVVASAGVAAAAPASAEARLRELPWVRVGSRLEPVSVALPERRADVVVAPRLAVDSQRLAVDLVKQGAGIARVNAFFVRDSLADGTLVEIVPEARSRQDVFAVYPRRSRPSARVRDFLDVLLEHARRRGIWDD